MKPYKWRMLLSLLIIIVLCFLDYQFFTEAPMADRVPDRERKIAHFIFLLLIIPIGYWGWKLHPIKWVKKLWLAAYIVSIIVMLVVGIMGWEFQMYNFRFLKDVGDFRLFFCSPLPFFILYVLSRVSNNAGQRKPAE